jgi:Tfp pilus assembly PilM family ATPase
MANFINGLDTYFEKHFNISVQLVDPISGFALEEKNILSDKTDGAPFGLAIGLALRRVPWLKSLSTL